MKKTYILLLIVSAVIIWSCKKNDAGGTIDTNLTGKWNLTEAKVGTGGPGQWIAVTDRGSYIQFNADGTLGGNYSPNYVRYTVKDSVTLNFYTTNNTEQHYSYSIKNSMLEMSPTGPILCIEGCTYRFTK